MANPIPADKIVYVQWLDSSMCHEQVDADRLPTPSVIHTVGWLADEGDDYLTVAREQNPDPDSYRWRSSVSIPRFAVLSIRHLSAPAAAPPPIKGDPLLVDHLEGNRRWRDRYRRAVREGNAAAKVCDHGGGCDRPSAPDHRLCEWHQGYHEAWRRISKAIGGFPITVYVDETGRRVAAS